MVYRTKSYSYVQEFNLAQSNIPPLQLNEKTAFKW